MILTEEERFTAIYENISLYKLDASQLSLRHILCFHSQGKFILGTNYKINYLFLTEKHVPF